MAVARTFRALELYDVLANLIPGAVLVLASTAVIEVENYFNFSSGTVAVGVFLISSLVLGHVIQALASELDGTPTLFGDIIEAVKEGTEPDDLSVNITHVEESIWPLIRRKFDLPHDFDDHGEIFRLLLSYIETTPTTRALRFQAIHSFHRSMWAMWYSVVILAPLALLLDCVGLLAARSWPVIALATFVGFCGIYIFNSRKEKFNRMFIEYAIADFYVDQMNDRG